MIVRNKIVSSLAKLAVVVLSAYISVLLLLYFYQRHLVFKPSGMLNPPASYGLSHIEPLILTTKDGLRLNAWYHGAPKEDAPVVIYFQGNAGNLSGRARKIALLANHMGVLALSYRGFGGSEGKPSEEGIYEDARTAIAYIKSRGVKESRIILYGESLGTGVAVQMAVEYSPAGVVLEAPYTSLVVLGARQYPYIPVDFLMKDHFDSLAKLKQVKSPLLMFHGEEDTVIPVEHSRVLLAAANTPKQAVFFPGVHHSDFDLEKITALTYAFALSVVR